MQAYDQERRKRATRLFHWSLDMPPGEDDVDVRVNKGLGWRELAVLAGTALGGLWLFSDKLPTPTPAPVQPIQGPVDSEYEVRFYDADGKPIEVPRIQQRAQ